MSQLLYTGAEFMHDLGNLTVIIVGAAGAMMTLYAVYIGFLFATASDANKRKAARERLYKVVGSAFIIIGLAIVLGTINVRFNKVEGNVSGTNSGANGNYSSQYSYSASVEMTPYYEKYTGKVMGSIVIDGANIKKDGKSVVTKNDDVQFTACEVVDPSDWTNTAKNQFVTSTKGKATYVYENNSSTIYCTSVNGVNVITMKVSFSMTSDPSKTYSVKLNVVLMSGTGVTIIAK